MTIVKLNCGGYLQNRNCFVKGIILNNLLKWLWHDEMLPSIATWPHSVDTFPSFFLPRLFSWTEYFQVHHSFLSSFLLSWLIRSPTLPSLFASPGVVYFDSDFQFFPPFCRTKLFKIQHTVIVSILLNSTIRSSRIPFVFFSWTKTLTQR